jgi:hypothetical protein
MRAAVPVLLAALSVGVICVLAGCGDDDGPKDVTAPRITVTAAAPKPPTVVAQSQQPATPAPSKPRTTGVESAAYRLAKAICSTHNASQVAKEYGGDPSDVGSVADAYGRRAAVPAARTSATDGCRAGLLG